MKPGDIVDARFEVEQLAGSGGMGAVYRARDLRTGATVAVKVLHGHRLTEIARFAREAEVLEGLDHPAVVRYVAQGTTAEGEAYLAMEWLEGESLTDRLARGRLVVAEVMVLAFRLAEALACAHRAGIVHRDLKPSNVMLVGGEIARAKLCDFGIARAGDSSKLTQTGAMLGTIGYMAPEQARGDSEIDARADVFALGAVVFKCLTGRAPFEGDDPLSALFRQATEDVPRLRDCLDEVPPAIDQLVARLLARSPAERPADAVAVLDELRRLGSPPSSSIPLRFKEGSASWRGPVAALTASSTLPAAKAPARRRLLVVVLAGLALFGGAGAVGLFVLLSPRSGPVGAPGASANVTPCALERCEPIDIPSPSAVDLRQITPKVRAMIQGIDRTAGLITISAITTKPTLPDTSSSTTTFVFRVNPPAGKPNRSALNANLFRGRLDLVWLNNTSDKVLPDPRCATSKLLSLARARGASGDVGLSYTYIYFAGTPAWVVAVLTPKPTTFMVRDSNCEVM